MKFGVLIMAFALCACAAPTELRQGIPDLDVTSDAPVERLAGCIGDKLEASSVASQNGQGRLSSRPTADGYSISEDQSLSGLYGSGTDTYVLVDLHRDAGKTHVQLYTHFMFPAGGRQISELVRGCLG